MNYLHIYAQARNHDGAYIVGTKESLLLLIEQISSTLRDGQYEQGSFFTADGEGFDLRVCVADEDDLQKLDLPYTDRKGMGLDQCPRGRSPEWLPWTGELCSGCGHPSDFHDANIDECHYGHCLCSKFKEQK